MITTVLLYGFLRKQFGKRHQFHLDRPSQAISALRANFPGFTAALTGHQAGYRVLLDDEPVDDAERLTYPFTVRRVKIVPVVGGASGVGRILTGIALIALAPLTGGTSLKFLGPVLSGIGTSLVLGGISQLLFKPPKAEGPREAAEDNPSYTFNGPVNTLAQGQCVPVLYGRMIVGGATASLGLHLDSVSETVNYGDFNPQFVGGTVGRILQAAQSTLYGINSQIVGG